MTAEAVCERVSAEMRDFYAKNREALGGRGFRVMYGPPVTKPPMLFIGYQPGGAEPGDDDLSHDTTPLWPAECDFAVKDWTLAAKMQDMFTRDVLSRCTGLNAVFVRAPNVRTYNAEVSSAARALVADFCRPRVVEIVTAIQPKLIVAIGFESLRFFGPTTPLPPSPRGRTTMIEGSIGGIPAAATLHLSGARISRSDRAAMATYLLKRAAA